MSPTCLTRTLTQKLLTDAGADSLDAVLAAVGAACSVRRSTFPAPEDGELCLGKVVGMRKRLRTREWLFRRVIHAACLCFGHECLRLDVYKLEACVYS